MISGHDKEFPKPLLRDLAISSRMLQFSMKTFDLHCTENLEVRTETFSETAKTHRIPFLKLHSTVN